MGPIATRPAKEIWMPAVMAAPFARHYARIRVALIVSHQAQSQAVETDRRSELPQL